MNGLLLTEAEVFLFSNEVICEVKQTSTASFIQVGPHAMVVWEH